MATKIDTEESQTTQARQSRRWVLAFLAGMLVLLGGFLSLMVSVAGARAQAFMPPEMAAAFKTPKDVVGDLGGMPVLIDRRIVRLVEYDGDPGWGEKREAPPPERNHTSRLKSFGFYVRFPDMKSLDNPELLVDFERHHPTAVPMEQGLRDQNPWLDGGVQSGSSYPGNGFLNRLYEGTILNPDLQPIGAQLVPEPSPVEGLELFIPRGNEPSTGRPWRYERSWGDRYIHRDGRGNTTTYIRCSYRRGTKRPTSCIQEWSMETYGLRIVISVSYAHALLPKWQEIQNKVSQFVLNFKDSKAADTSQPTSGIPR